MIGLKDNIRQNKFLRWGLIITNWFFQGIRRADTTEKIYKLLFTLILTILISFLFHRVLSCTMVSSVLWGFIIGHTLNWLINNNWTNLIIHRLFLSKLNKVKAFDYLDSLKNRLKNKPFVLYATTHGSICNGNLKPSSDIDVALVRKRGFKNALQSLWFVLVEKKIADLHKIPLEIYLSDSPEYAIAKFKKEQNPVVITERDNILDNYYAEKLTLEEAKKLNGL